MDEQTLFRATHDDVVTLDDIRLAAGHARLLQQIEKRGRRAVRTPHRRTVRRIGLGALAAGGMAAVLLIAGTIVPAGTTGGADAAAAEVLTDAAQATITTSDPIVGPGQYLAVRTTGINTVNGGLADGTVGDYQTRVTDTLYVPSERDVPWVWVRGNFTLEKTFGAASAAVASEAFSAEQAEPQVVSGIDGNFYGSPNRYAPSVLASLPREPRILLNVIYASTRGAGQSADGEALVYIADALRSGLIPADLRAAFYKAAILIPGVAVTDRQATLDGRTGIAIGRLEPASDVRQDIIIDPSTGLLIGERTISFATDTDVPPGTAVRWASITTSVTDSIPAGSAGEGR